jgi:hypothetical protein
MRNNNDKVIDASSLLIRGTLPTENNSATMRTPSSVVEAAIRVLGTMLVLYRHYVPNSEYYKVHDTVVQ